jgi:hypothetical protein
VIISDVLKVAHKENRGFIYEMAVAFVIIYMRVFHQCPNLIGFLASSFPADNSKTNQEVIMDILGAVPETMVSTSLVIEKDLRKSFMEFALTKLQPEILENLNAASRGELNEDRRYQLLKCFDSWLIDGTTDLVKQNLHNSNLVGIAVQELHNTDGQNQEVAADTLQSIMFICKKSLDYASLYDNLLATCFSYGPTIKKIISQGLREDVKPILYVYGKLLSRVFKQILACPDNKVISFMLYDVFLAVLKNSEIELGVDVLGYIEKLIDDLKLVQDPTEIQNRNQFVSFHEEFFKTAVLTSVDVCTYTLQQFVYKEDIYYSDEQDKYMDDDLNSKETEREAARSMIKELTELVGFTKIFSFVAPRVSQSAEAMKNSAGESQEHPHSLIAKFEAELKCISSMIHRVDPKIESDVKLVQNFLEFILQTGAPNDLLKEAILKILSKAKGCFAGRPDLLQTSFKVIGEFNHKQSFEVLAAECMSSLCSDNPEFVLQNIKDFLNCNFFSYLSLHKLYRERRIRPGIS